MIIKQFRQQQYVKKHSSSYEQIFLKEFINKKEKALKCSIEFNKLASFLHKCGMLRQIQNGEEVAKEVLRSSTYKYIEKNQVVYPNENLIFLVIAGKQSHLIDKKINNNVCDIIKQCESQMEKLEDEIKVCSSYEKIIKQINDNNSNTILEKEPNILFLEDQLEYINLDENNQEINKSQQSLQIERLEECHILEMSLLIFYKIFQSTLTQLVIVNNSLLQAPQQFSPQSLSPLALAFTHQTYTDVNKIDLYKNLMIVYSGWLKFSRNEKQLTLCEGAVVGIENNNYRCRYKVLEISMPLICYTIDKTIYQHYRQTIFHQQLSSQHFTSNINNNKIPPIRKRQNSSFQNQNKIKKTLRISCNSMIEQQLLDTSNFINDTSFNLSNKGTKSNKLQSSSRPSSTMLFSQEKNPLKQQPNEEEAQPFASSFVNNIDNSKIRSFSSPPVKTVDITDKQISEIFTIHSKKSLIGKTDQKTQSHLNYLLEVSSQLIQQDEPKLSKNSKTSQGRIVRLASFTSRNSPTESPRKVRKISNVSHSPDNFLNETTQIVNQQIEKDETCLLKEKEFKEVQYLQQEIETSQKDEESYSKKNLNEIINYENKQLENTHNLIQTESDKDVNLNKENKKLFCEGEIEEDQFSGLKQMYSSNGNNLQNNKTELIRMVSNKSQNSNYDNQFFRCSRTSTTQQNVFFQHENKSPKQIMNKPIIILQKKQNQQLRLIKFSQRQQNVQKILKSPAILSLFPLESPQYIQSGENNISTSISNYNKCQVNQFNEQKVFGNRYGPGNPALYNRYISFKSKAARYSSQQSQKQNLLEEMQKIHYYDSNTLSLLTQQNPQLLILSENQFQAKKNSQELNERNFKKNHKQITKQSNNNSQLTALEEIKPLTVELFRQVF